MAYKKSAETRQRIVEATKKLIVEKGYYDTNIKDIAQEANIAHPCIYYYFKNKESIAREIFDNVSDKVLHASAAIYKENPDLLLNTMISYILLFKHIATKKATQTVYYDLVQYSNYDKANLDRLKKTLFKRMSELYEEYHGEVTDEQITAFILTSDAFAKALFKGMLNGLLNFTLEDAADYFFRHMLLSNLKISEEVYKEKLEEAFRVCETVIIDE